MLKEEIDQRSKKRIKICCACIIVVLVLLLIPNSVTEYTAVLIVGIFLIVIVILIGIVKDIITLLKEEK